MAYTITEYGVRLTHGPHKGMLVVVRNSIEAARDAAISFVGDDESKHEIVTRQATFTEWVKA